MKNAMCVTIASMLCACSGQGPGVDSEQVNATEREVTAVKGTVEAQRTYDMTKDGEPIYNWTRVVKNQDGTETVTHGTMTASVEKAWVARRLALRAFTLSSYLRSTR